MIGSSWFSCCVGDKYKSVTKQFVMPSHTSGQPMPGFAGGSAPPSPSVPTRRQLSTGSPRSRALSREGSPGERQRPERHQSAREQRERARRSQDLVRPDRQELVNVENGNILRTMLARILTGKMTIKDAAATARQHRLHPEPAVEAHVRDADLDAE